MRRFIIDTDTASDDSVALVMALRDPRISVDAITVQQGNVPLATALQAALYTVEVCGASVPVYAGTDRPFMRPPEFAHHVHGQDGMGDVGLPLTGRTPAQGHAADELIRRFGAEPGEIELITLGPLTNVGLALLREPRLAGWVKRCWMMGGAADGQGNIGVAGEFNIWHDPEAAKVVFESGMPITMVGWDPCKHDSVLDSAEQESIRAVGSELANFVIDIQAVLIKFTEGQLRAGGISLPDPLAVAVAIEPEIAQTEGPHFVTVSCDDGITRGQTVVDRYQILGREPNTTVVNRADHTRFVEMLHDAVR